MRSSAIDALVVVLVASAPVAIERLRGLVHAAGDLAYMFIPHYAWWWSRPRWLGGWNAWIFGGFPSNADPLVGHVHPLGLLWAAFSPVTASALEGAAAPGLAGLGMLVYLRRIGCGRTGSMVGAIAFASGGYVHAHAIHPEKLRSVLAIPWALAAIEALEGRRLLAGLGGAVAVVVAGGHPQTIAFSLGLVAIYGLVFASGRRAWVVAALAVGVAVPAVTWLPAIELVQRSRHVHTLLLGVDYMTAACAHTLVVPFGCGGGSGPFYGRSIEQFPGCGIVDCTSYLGMLVCLLVVAGLPRVFSMGRGRFWIVIGVAGLVLSTEVTERLLQIPGLRAPSRALLWFDLAAAAVAGLVLRTADEGRWSRRSWAVAVLVLFGVVAWSATRGPVARRASLGSLVVLAATAVVARRPAHWPIVGVLVADLVVFGAEFHFGVPPSFAEPARSELRRTRELTEHAGGAAGSWGRAVAVPALHNSMWAQMERVRTLQGWNVLVPASFSHLMAGDVPPERWFGYDFGVVSTPALLRQHNHVLDLVRARVVSMRKRIRGSEWTDPLVLPRWRPAGESAEFRYYLNERVQPVAWLVHRVRVVARDEALRVIHGDTGTFAPGEEALADEALPVAPAATPGSVRVVTYDDDLIALRVTAHAPGLVVTSELAYPGWRADVDGNDAPVHTVNAAFRAVVVPPGEHDVVLRYRPTAGRVGLGIGGLALAVLLACAASGRRAQDVPA